jgi:hypothetical protein
MSGRRCMSAGSLILIGIITGCGTGKGRIALAEGSVTIDGKPAANIKVRFMPDAQSGQHSPSSSGVTDQEGRFKLRCDDGRQGAVPGKHMVALFDLEHERPERDQETPALSRLNRKYQFPASYVAVEVRDGQSIAIDVEGAR